MKQGHSVFLLTQNARGAYHDSCESLGVRCYSHVVPKNGPLYFLRHAIFLCQFIRRHGVQVVYAHLENAGLPAVLIRPFVKAEVFTCRHIVDEARLMGSRKFEWLNRIVYRLSKNSIVVSQRSRRWMIEEEGINEKKIRVIPLAYNFELYPKANPDVVAQIRNLYPSRFLLVTAGRLVNGKRPDLSVMVCEQLVKDGLDVKLLLLGEGPLRAELQSYIKRHSLEPHVFLLGHQTNIIDYLTACDLLVHPSLQDSSSVIIKEAGLCSRAVICCDEVGDVDEYIRDKEQAIKVSKTHTETEMVMHIKRLLASPEELTGMGKALNQIVKARFSISVILPVYTALHQEIEAKWKN